MAASEQREVVEPESASLHEYISPLEILYDRNFRQINRQEAMEYTGTLGDVITQLKSALSDTSTLENQITIAFHPSRIIRAIMDYQIEHADPQYEGTLKKACDLMLKIYQNNGDTKSIQSTLEDVETDQLLQRMVQEKYPVHQRYDSISYIASDPFFSKKTAKRIYNESKGNPIVFIPMGHGGTMPGAEVFTRFLNKVQGTEQAANSSFLPVRFSRGKKGDTNPRFSEEEIIQLGKEANEGKVIFIFEEDIIKSATAKDAREFLINKLNLPPEKQDQIKIISNVNMRRDGSTIALLSFAFLRPLLRH